MNATTKEQTLALSGSKLTSLSNPRDVIGSFQEIFETLSVNARVYRHEISQGQQVVQTNLKYVVRHKEQLADRIKFGQGPFRYDTINFLGTRYLEQDATVPLWEHYSLDVSDGDFAVASLWSEINRVGHPEGSQSLSLNDYPITPRFGGAPDICQAVTAHKLFPIIRTALHAIEVVVF